MTATPSNRVTRKGGGGPTTRPQRGMRRKVKMSEPPDRVLLGIAVGCGILIYELVKLVAKIVYLAVWHDPKDVRDPSPKGKRNARKKA